MYVPHMFSLPSFEGGAFVCAWRITRDIGMLGSTERCCNPPVFREEERDSPVEDSSNSCTR